MKEPDMKFLVSASVKVCILIFWVYTPCNTGDVNLHFEETYCLHLQGDSRFFRSNISCITRSINPDQHWNQLQLMLQYDVRT